MNEEQLEKLKLIASTANELLVELGEEVPAGAEATGAGFEIPSPEEIAELDKEGLVALAAAWGVEEDSMPKSPKTLARVLTAVATLATKGELDEDDADDYAEFANWVALDVGDSDPGNVVYSYLTQGGEEESDETPAEEEGGSETPPEAEGEGTVEITEEMIAIYNKVAAAAGEKALPKNLDKAAAKLAELLEDDDGNTAEWGTPYIRKRGGWCCGLTMGDVEGHDMRGVCHVTGKVWEFDPEKGFVEVEEEPAPPPPAKKPALVKKKVVARKK